MKKLLGLFILLGLSINTQVVLADDDDNDNAACPTNINVATDTNYGLGTSDATRCLENRKKVKVVMQINKSCRDSFTDPAGNVKNSASAAKCASTRAYALGNMRNMIADYEAHGMVAGEDFDMIAVVHSGGGFQLMNNTNMNQFQTQVTDLMAKGVKFYFCLNTVKGFIKRGFLSNPAVSGISVSEQLVPGTQFVTAGVTAIADFQEEGYMYVQP